MRSWPSIVKRANGKLFQVRSRITGVGSTTGFVVGLSRDLILFHVLDMNVFRLNGYAVIHIDDVKNYRVFDKPHYWQSRAVRLFKLKPVSPPGILLSSFAELLQCIGNRHLLMALHRERKNPNVCYIGRLLSMTDANFTIDDLDCNAEWSGPRRLKFNDITRVNFGGGYEQALGATAPKRSAKKS